MKKETDIRDMLGRKKLVSVDEAGRIVRETFAPFRVDTEIVPLDDSLDRVIAAPILSPEDLPAHSRSTMDGFAVFSRDTFGAKPSMPGYLQISGEIRMGENPCIPVKRGECQRIATGGLLPPGSDAVLMLEHTVAVDETMIEVTRGVAPGTNVIQGGEDIAFQDEALAAGHVLRPQDLGLLAGLGIMEVTVHRRVRVGILSTGDEIVPCSETPPSGKIRDVNSIALKGQALRTGAMVTDYPIISDQKDVFMKYVAQAVRENDIVLFSGGSSVGARDFGEQVIGALGSPGVLVHGVALKPGKPIIIGLCGKIPVFGLPGHPVSAMVCFDLFVKAAIHLLGGRRQLPLPTPSVYGRLRRNLNSAAGRRDLVRVCLVRENGQWQVDPVLGKSGSISTLSRAHGYLLIEESCQGLPVDARVEVFLFT